MKEKVFEYTVPQDSTVKIEQSENSFVVLIEPKQVEFKDGDIISAPCLYQTCSRWIAICKNIDGDIINYHALMTLDESILIDMHCDKDRFALATEDEQQILFDALAKEGKQWNHEKKCIEPLKWQPKQGDEVHRVIFDRDKNKFIIHSFTWIFGCKFNDCIKPSLKEAQQLCSVLNLALYEK